MEIGSFFRIEGMLLAGGACLYVRTSDGSLWDIGRLKDIGHLLQKNVVVEGIRTGIGTIAVNWIEALKPLAKAELVLRFNRG